MVKCFNKTSASQAFLNGDSVDVLNLLDGTSPADASVLIAKVVQMRDKGVIQAEIPEAAHIDSASQSTTLTSSVLVIMPANFRNGIWLRRGSLILIQRTSGGEDSKMEWSLLCILSTDQIKTLKKADKW